MKKLFLIVFIFFVSITSSFAAFFIDGQGNYIATGELDPVIGFGGGVGFGLSDDVNLLFRCSLSTNTENAGLINEIRYEYSFAAIGIEFIPKIALLEQYRLYWKNSVNVGASEFEVDSDFGDKQKFGPGIFTSFHTGLQFNYTQIVAPYFDLGYHKSFYDSTENISIKGFYAAVGVRFYVFGNKDQNAEY